MYRYIWKSDQNQEEFDSEVALAILHPESCLPNTHEWHTTYAFGIYDCVKCQARRITVYERRDRRKYK